MVSVLSWLFGVKTGSLRADCIVGHQWRRGSGLFDPPVCSRCGEDRMEWNVYAPCRESESATP